MELGVSTMAKKYTYVQIMDRVRDMIKQFDGEDLAKLHNDLCMAKVKFNESEDVWDEMDIDADGNCQYCGKECWNGDLCDEQQAGGFNKEIK